MPNLFQVKGYRIYFWSNENGEPIHVHITAGVPGRNTTKVWLTSRGGCILCNNQSQIPESDLNDLLDVIEAQFFYICRKWKDFFKVDEISFYC